MKLRLVLFTFHCQLIQTAVFEVAVSHRKNSSMSHDNEKAKPDRHKVNAVPIFLPWYLSEHPFSYFHKLCENFTVERKDYTVQGSVFLCRLLVKNGLLRILICSTACYKQLILQRSQRKQAVGRVRCSRCWKWPAPGVFP